MPKDWPQDIKNMHDHYGVTNAMKQLTPEMLQSYLTFRFNFLQEELNEGRKAIEGGDSEEIVDSLIDLCVVAIGTLDVYGVDPHLAWDEVLHANMNKIVGVKASRPNPYKLPDLIKPTGWVAPSHKGNHGIIPNAFSPKVHEHPASTVAEIQKKWADAVSETY